MNNRQKKVLKIGSIIIIVVISVLAIIYNNSTIKSAIYQNTLCPNGQLINYVCNEEPKSENKTSTISVFASNKLEANLFNELFDQYPELNAVDNKNTNSINPKQFLDKDKKYSFLSTVDLEDYLAETVAVFQDLSNDYSPESQLFLNYTNYKKKISELIEYINYANSKAYGGFYITNDKEVDSIASQMGLIKYNKEDIETKPIDFLLYNTDKTDENSKELKSKAEQKSIEIIEYSQDEILNSSDYPLKIEDIVDKILTKVPKRRSVFE